MRLKALIVDDERLARKELKHLLSEIDADVEVLEEADNSDAAQALIENQHFDLVFLDIQMPGRNGFELLDDLSVCPPVIFTTAYDQYALAAFEANAIDYLLKPIENDRLKAAIEKAATAGYIETSSNKIAQAEDYRDHIFIKDGEICWYVALTDLIAFGSEGNYCRVYMADAEPLIRKSLNQLQDKLNTDQFFRISRQHIINLRKITSVAVSEADTLEVTMENGLTLEMSRRQSQAFREKMSF
ncbi:MAG: DNA-binding response regulator [Kordiimonadales bacterium]|nr:MAG: DNA-binding response regulator [Kordiimonadales bacterium]